jgi:hypothetical protein
MNNSNYESTYVAGSPNDQGSKRCTIEICLNTRTAAHLIQPQHNSLLNALKRLTDVILTPLPAERSSSTSCQDRRTKTSQVVSNVPHAPVGASLLSCKPRGQDACTAWTTKALHITNVSVSPGHACQSNVARNWRCWQYCSSPEGRH